MRDWYSFPEPTITDYGDIDSSATNTLNYGYFNTNDFFDARLINGTSNNLLYYDAYDPYFEVYLEEHYYDTAEIESLLPHMPSGKAVGHGDWVLQAFCDTLDNPENTEILAIDIDFNSSGDFDYLFRDMSSDSGIQNRFNGIVTEFMNGLNK